MLRNPAVDQFSQDLELRFRIRKTAFGVAGIDAQAVIERAVERCRVAQKFGVGALQVTHGFDDIDALGRVQHFVENAGGF